MSRENIEAVKNLFPDLDDDTIAAFLQSNGNNVERTIDSLLNNSGGFNDYEFQETGFDAGYNQQAWNKPAPKPEKILTPEELYTQARQAYKAGKFGNSKKDTMQVLESDVINGLHSVWGFRAILLLIKSLIQNKEDNFTDYLTLLCTEYKLHLLEFGPSFVSLFLFFLKMQQAKEQQQRVNARNHFYAVVDLIDDPVFCMTYLRQIAILVLTADEMKAYPRLNWVRDNIRLITDMTVIATEEQLENRIKFGTMPGLSTIGFEKVTVAGGKNMKNKILISLCNAIRLSPSITEYSLSSPKIDSVTARIVADSFANHYSLQSLNISETAIGTEGATLVLQAVQFLPSLTKLNLEYNKIGSKTLFAALPTSLVELDLSSNSLGNEGCKKLAIYLANNLALKKLSLQADLSISDDGVLALMDAVAAHPTLENLNLSYLNLNVSTIGKFLECVSANSSLLVVDFSNILDANAKKSLTNLQLRFKYLL